MLSDDEGPVSIAIDGTAHTVPKLAVRTHPTETTRATAAAHRLQAALAHSTGLPLVVDAHGGDLVIATTQAYAHAVEGSSGLGRQALARLALGAVPPQVSVAVYVDLTKILPLVGAGVPPDVRSLKAIGFWAGSTGSVQQVQLRVVVG